jgi:tetratricopeptide (TPR) repeat protein
MPIQAVRVGIIERLHRCWQTAGVVFVADAFGAWLVEQLADAGRKKLTELVLGSEQERALRRAADAAVRATAVEMSGSGGEHAGQVAMVIGEVFRDPVPDAPLAGPVMLLEGLQTGIAGQLAVLDDAEVTGTGQSSADVLGVPGSVLADKLTRHLVREIIVRGSGGGPLTPLADQLNHELTRLQGQRIEGMLVRLAREVRDALARPGSDVTAAGRMSSAMALAEYTRAWKAAGPVVVGDIPQHPPGFQPRPGLLAELAPIEQGTPVVHALTGMAGAGKTQLAAAHARARAAEQWRLVAWVNAGTPASLLADLGAAVEALELTDAASRRQSSDDAGHMIRRWLEADGSRCLLVFDNATDPDMLRPFLPASGAAQVLITSSRQSIAHLGALVAITVFTAEEAAAYLIGQTGLADAADAAAVAAELGFLPLALAQAAGVIAAQRLTYRTYLDRLRSLPAGEYLIREQGQPYPRSVVDAVLLSLDALQAADQGEVSIATLEFMAVLSPSGVRRDLLYAAGEQGALASGGAGKLAASKVDRALGLLGERSLLTFSVSGETVSSHRLILRVVRDNLVSDERLSGLCLAAALVLGAREAVLAGSQDRPALRDIADQVMALRDSAATTSCSGNGKLAGLLARLQLRALYILNRLGDSARHAITVGEPLIRDLERLAGPGHPETLNARSDLAEAYRAAGRMAEATGMHEQVLAVREQLLGPDDPGTVNSWNNLSEAYRAAGRTDEAVSVLERTVAACATMFGPDDPRTLTARNNLALSYEDAGRTGEGLRLHEQTLADRERVLGPGHPDTFNSRNNLAEAHRAAGRTDKAIHLHKQNLANRKQVLGSDHPLTLTSQNNLAGTYLGVGRTAEAIPLFEQALAGLERAQGSNHPDALRSRINLAVLYHQGGRAAEAISLYEQTLLAIEQVLGPDNPAAVAFRDHLAIARKDADANEQASHPHLPRR